MAHTQKQITPENIKTFFRQMFTRNEVCSALPGMNFLDIQEAAKERRVEVFYLNTNTFKIIYSPTMHIA